MYAFFTAVMGKMDYEYEISTKYIIFGNGKHIFKEKYVLLFIFS